MGVHWIKSGWSGWETGIVINSSASKGGSEVKKKNPSANTRDVDSTPGSGRSPGEGNGNPLQYSH